MKICRLLIAVASLVATGCTYSIHQVQVSDFQPYAPLERGDVVKGYGEQFVILGFTRETNYVDAAYKNIMNACPNGSLSGITTQISTAHGFFSWTNKALMQGLCLAKGVSAGGDSARRVNDQASPGSTRRKPSSDEILTDWISEEI
jgi:hypothetical protein